MIQANIWNPSITVWIGRFIRGSPHGKCNQLCVSPWSSKFSGVIVLCHNQTMGKYILSFDHGVPRGLNIIPYNFFVYVYERGQVLSQEDFSELNCKHTALVEEASRRERQAQRFADEVWHKFSLIHPIHFYCQAKRFLIALPNMMNAALIGHRLASRPQSTCSDEYLWLPPELWLIVMYFAFPFVPRLHK